MKRSESIIGHLSCFVAYAIFGYNNIVCKDLSNSSLISPMGLFCIRALVATVLFWTLSFFLPREKVDKKDLPKILAASLLGLLGPQYTFLVAVTYITPMDTSILAALTPIFTMFLAAIILKEPITWKKAGGVALSLAGVLLLIFNSVSLHQGVAQTQPIGVVLMMLNCLCFSLYLALFKPLIAKYSVVTFMKWMFLFSAMVSLPIKGAEVFRLSYAQMPPTILFDLGFLVIFSTFIAYFLIPMGQKRLRPTVVCMYIYLQPIVSSVISICYGMDVLTWEKALAALAVLGGVVLVNRSRSRAA